MDVCAPGSEPSPCRLQNSHSPAKQVRAQKVPSPCRLRRAAVRMEECVPGGCRAQAGYEQPPSRWTSARPAAYPAPAGYATAAVWLCECAPGGYPAHAGNEQPPSGLTSARSAATPRTHNTQHNTSGQHNGEQEPSHPGHGTRSTTHQACTPVIRIQVTQDTARATPHTGQAHQ